MHDIPSTPGLEIQINLTSNKYVHQREAEKIYDVLGDIGGYIEIQIMLFGFFLAGYPQIIFNGVLA